MKKILIFICTVLIVGCSNKDSSLKLQDGTEEYALAVALSNISPVLDPDKNSIWVSCKEFDITTADVLATMKRIYGNKIVMMKSFDADRLIQTFSTTAQDLAVKRLMLRESQKAGMKVEDTEIEQMVENTIYRTADKQQYLKDLQRQGLTIEDIKEDIRNRLMAEKYLEKVLGSRVTVTEAEIIKEYKREKYATVQNIVMQTSQMQGAEKEKIHAELLEVLQQARNGADFTELVKRYSHDPAAKQNEGRFRIVRGEGEWYSAIEDAAFSLPLGEVSDIIRTPQGLHLIKVIERHSEPLPLDKIRPQLERSIWLQKRAIENKRLVDELKRNNEFQVFEYES